MRAGICQLGLMPSESLRLVLLLLACVLLAGCVTNRGTTWVVGRNLDELSRDYMQVQLEIGEHDEGYIDAYYGPPEWRETARANRRDLEEL